MAADASIYGQAGKIRSVADFARENQVLQNEQQQGELNALQLLTGKAGLAEKQRQSQEQNALRTLLGDASFNRRAPDAAARLYQVAPGSADAVIKGWQAQDKAEADIGKVKADTDSVLLDQANKKLSRLKEYIGTATSPQQVAEVLKSADADPHLGPVLRMQGSLQDQMAQLQGLQSPEQFQMWQLQRSKGVDDLLKFTTPDANAKLSAQTSKENTAANNARQAADNAAARAVQMRGQNLTDARSRESNSAAMSKPFEVTGPDGLPILVRQDKAGNITPVEGYGPKTGASKPLNDTQAKALLFGTRMQEANKALESLDGKYSPSAVNAKTSAEGLPIIGGIAGMAGNALLSEAGQQAEQAQRDFVNAVLRRESGAVISDQEFANAKKQYFPQPNDKPGTLEQKKRNRQLAIDGLLAEVPEGRRQSIAPKAAPNIDSLLDKYK